MAVPAHDERDHEFALQFRLPILSVISEEGLSINSSNGDVNLNGLPIEESKKRVVQWIEKKKIGKKTVQYKLRDWLFSRQRYWGEPVPIVHFEDGSMRSLGLDELPLEPPEVSEYKPSPSGESPLAKVTDWVYVDDPVTKRKAKERPIRCLSGLALAGIT